MALTQVRRDTIVRLDTDVPANSSGYSCDSRIESRPRANVFSWTNEKTRTTCKQMQDHNENSKTEDTVLLTRDGGAPLVEEFDTYSSIQNHEEYTSGDIMSKSDKNMCDKDVHVADLPSSVRKVIYKCEETESFKTVNLEAESCGNEKSKDINYTAQNKTDDIVQTAANSNPDKKIEREKTDRDQDVEKIDFIKHDNNNNSEFMTSSVLEMDNKKKSTCKDVESNKISMETKSKNVPVKLPINESKMNIKNDGGATLSKNNEKFPTFGTDSKKSVSNLSKSTISVNKGTKVDRSNNRHAYARNIACIRREEFVKQRSVSRDGTENEKKDIAVKSSVSKTDVETELNKMFDATSQGKNTNKNKLSQKQQSVNKQFMSKTKSQESFRKSAPVSNSNKDNTLEKTENGMYVSKSFELNGSEKKDQEAVGEKNSRNDQKANNGINVRRSATFVAQYKNSTFSKQASSTPNKTEYASTYGKNSYTRNNSKSYRERADNVGRKGATQKDYTPSPINSKFNKRTEAFGANNLENHAKRQNETDACNYKNMNPVKVETQLTENKESANSLSVDAHAEEKYSAIEQIREGMETTEESKVDMNQQDVIVTNKMINEEINKSNDDKYTMESQIDVTTYQHLKPENTQCMDNTKQLENNQTWCNVSSTIVQRNNTNANAQQIIPNMHFGMQQIGAQAEDLPRQMWASDCGRYYEQHFATEDLTRLGSVPNMTCDAISYENNFQTAPNDGDVAVPPAMLEIAIDRNRENSNALYKYNMPHVHTRPVASLSNFPGYSVSSGHNNRWSPTLQEGGVHIEHPAYNVTQQLAAMQVYKSGPDDFNAHATNCLPPPIVYAPCMQAWNPQLQYPMPVFYNSSYGGYAMFSDTILPQSSEFDDSGSMHNQQQSKYIAHTQMNNYARSARGYDSNAYSVQARNTVDNVPVKSNQYYKRYHDNYRTTYDVPRQAPISYPRSQQAMNYTSASGNMSQRNAHYSQSPKYYRQNVNSSTQIPKKPHDQRIQDFVCDDNALEDIPPMISPKEFITSNMNLSNRNDQFTTQAFKPEFKVNPNADYRPPLWQRYNNNFRRNASCQEFSRDNGSPVSIGRGTYKSKKL